uniref:RNA-directed DNA polymerase, eukaryota, reverse transcriptase zinc-binding domain protein n=1 Tax=Tanacetum cinerariifolium TaxID=118510 RepID=A0A699KP90_TANCI|nr:RNA-directed DNA polymerase, eukaryota, reverse transcriptase zinc-binding domain protein [Tanacetum cinerariifolium]
MKEEQEKNVGTIVKDVMEDIASTTKVMKDNVTSSIKDRSEANIKVLNKTNQSIFCLVSAEQNNVKCFYTFVYAENDGSDIKELWKSLELDRRFDNGKPWCILGDMNVTLSTSEHSSGSSSVTIDMVKFNECINKIEVEDKCSSGL